MATDNHRFALTWSGTCPGCRIVVTLTAGGIPEDCRPDEPNGDTRGSVWTFPPGGSGPSHLAPFPDELARRCILPSTEEGDIVFDPFAGSGTTVRVANELGRRGLGLDLYPTVLA